MDLASLGPEYYLSNFFLFFFINLKPLEKLSTTYHAPTSRPRQATGIP